MSINKSTISFHFSSLLALSNKQGCGCGLIQSGSSILAQSGSSSGFNLKQNFRRQFLSQIFLKSKFESNQIKNIGVIHQKIFQKVVSAFYLFSGKIFLKIPVTKLKFLNFLAPGSGSGIRSPNTDPDPQSHWIRTHNPANKYGTKNFPHGHWYVLSGHKYWRVWRVSMEVLLFFF
jgi:hypothetical protein